MSIPSQYKPIIEDFLKSHFPNKTHVYDKGQFLNYSTSKSSCCWGINGFVHIQNTPYLIAVCQPTNDLGVIFYDVVNPIVLINTLNECVTNPGSCAMSKHDENSAIRRLQYINDLIKNNN